MYLKIILICLSLFMSSATSIFVMYFNLGQTETCSSCKGLLHHVTWTCHHIATPLFYITHSPSLSKNAHTPVTNPSLVALLSSLLYNFYPYPKLQPWVIAHKHHHTKFTQQQQHNYMKPMLPHTTTYTQ